VSTEPVGAHESRHVTAIAEGDHVWDTELGRWRLVTSALTYTTERTKQRMVKLVFDLSTYVRHVVDDGPQYDVLLDDEPQPHVIPETATARRRRLRGKATEEVEVAPSVKTSETPQAVPTPVAGGVQSAGDVRTRREALRIPRARFAELCGLTPGALWRVEDGRPKDDELDRVLQTLTKQEART
jgi:hypothetical protein